MTRQQQLLDLLETQGAMTFAQIREALNVGRSNLARILSDAAKAGLIIRVGNRRLYEYTLAKRIPNSVFDLGRFGKLHYELNP